MKKSFLIILGCIISVVIFQAFTTSSDPEWQNLKILPKDISKQGLDSVMHHFTVALGVKCNFCHVRNEAERKMDFASDDKPEKNIARKMMLMSIDINKNYFKNMEHHDMDHDHDMNSNDHNMDKDHDHDAMDKDKDHDDMDNTAMNAEPSTYMLRTVTCFTCHRGDAHPESKIPSQPMGPRPAEQQKPPTDGK